MSDDLKPLEDWLASITRGLSDQEVRALGRKLATVERRLNAKRIRANLTPDGAAMAPRKIQHGKVRAGLQESKRAIRRKLMFQRATRPSYLRIWGDASGARVGFVGAVARIMRVHHYGLVDAVSHEAGAKKVKYAARPILGIPATDREQLLDVAIEWLGQRTARHG